MRTSNLTLLLAGLLLVAVSALECVAAEEETTPPGPVEIAEVVEPEVATARAVLASERAPAATPVEIFDAALTLMRHRRFDEAASALDRIATGSAPPDSALSAAARAIHQSLDEVTTRVPIAELAASIEAAHGPALGRRVEAVLWNFIGTRSPEVIDPRVEADAIAALHRLAGEIPDPRLEVDAEIMAAMVAIRVPDYGEAQRAVERARAVLERANDPCCTMQVHEVEGRICFLMERFDEGEAPLRIALELAAAHRLRVDQQSLESFLGQSLLFQGKFDDALSHLRNSLDLARGLDSPHRVFSATESLGMAHYALRDFEAGKREFAECAAIAERLDDLTLRTSALRNIAMGHYASDDLPGAIQVLESMRSTAEMANDLDSLLEAEARLAETSGLVGNLAAMLAYAKRGLERSNASNFQSFEIELRMSAARAHSDLGEFDAALRECATATDEARRRGGRITCANALMLRSKILLELGDHAASLASAEEALELTRPSDPGRVEPRARLHVAMAKLSLGRLDEAAADAAKVRESVQDDEFTVLQSTWIEARIAIRRGDYDTALILADQVRNRSQQFGNIDFAQRGAVLAADAALAAMREDEPSLLAMAPRVQSALDEALASDNRRLRAAARVISTRLCIARRDLAAARRCVEAALADIEGFAGTEAGMSLGVERASNLRSDFSQLGELAQDLTIAEIAQAKDEAEIAEITRRGYEHVVRFKSRALLEGILEHRARGRTKETTRLEALRRERVDTKERALIAAARALRSKDPDAAEQARKQAEDCARDIERIEGELASAGARDAQRVRELTPNLTALRAAGHASADSIILDFVASTTSLHVFRIDGSTLETRRIGDLVEIQREIERYRDLIANKDALGSVADVARLGHDLYEKLLAPCLPATGSASNSPLPTRIIVIPEGVIATLPFEALVVSATAAPKDFTEVEFALDRFDITYAPSVSVLLELSSEQKSDEARAVGERSALILADPALGDSFAALPAARLEGELVARQFAHSKLLIGEHARSRELDTDLAAYSVLHFAVHGTVNSASALGTGLWLRGDPDGPEFFSVSNVMDLDLDADLVVLSACSSSRGAYRDGEGIESLARGFLFAGARTVIASQWELQDSSALGIMSTFYDRLVRGGVRAREALLLAKRDLRHRNATPGQKPDPARGVGSVRSTPTNGATAIAGHPYLWAPLIHIGADPRRN